MNTDNRTNEPTHAMVRAAHRAYYDADPYAGYMQAMKAALVAAATIPKPVLDPEKVVKIVDAGIAEYLREDLPEDGFNEADVIARALCEAAKRGELSA